MCQISIEFNITNQDKISHELQISCKNICLGPGNLVDQWWLAGVHWLIQSWFSISVAPK